MLKCKLNSLYNFDTPIGILGKSERLVAPEKPFTNYSHWCSIISPFSSTNWNHHNMLCIVQCCFLCNPFPAPSKTTGWCSTLALLRPFARHLSPGKWSSRLLICSRFDEMVVKPWWWFSTHGRSESVKKRSPKSNQLNTFPKNLQPNLQPTGPRCFHQRHAGLVREEAIEFRRPILHLWQHTSSREAPVEEYQPWEPTTFNFRGYKL